MLLFLPKAISIMEKDRQRLLEDKKALQDAIKRAVTANDQKEIDRLTKHLEWLDNYLRKGETK